MFGRKRKSPEEKGQLFGEILASILPDMVGFLAKSFEQDGLVPWANNKSQSVQFSVECLAFYIHLIEATGYRFLTAADFEIFRTNFRTTVLNAVDHYGDLLMDTFNRRRTEFASYKEWMPATRDAPLKNTLFWEFSKVLSATVGDKNPICQTILATKLAEWFTILDDHMKLVKTFKE